MTRRSYVPRPAITRFGSLQAMLLLVVVTVLGYAALARVPIPLEHQLDSIPRLDLRLGSATPHDEPVSVLIAGVAPGELAGIVEADPAGWAPGSHRAESLTLLHLPADRRRAFLVSIPLDASAATGHGVGRLDAAFSDGGPLLLVDAVEELTGAHIDHLALAERDGFGYLADELRSWSDALTNPLRLRYALRAAGRSVAVDEGLSTDRLRDLTGSLRDLRPDDVVQLSVPVEPAAAMGESGSGVDSRGVVDAAATRELFGAIAAQGND